MGHEMLSGQRRRGSLALLATTIVATAVTAASISRGAGGLPAAIAVGVVGATLITVAVQRVMIRSRRRVMRLRRALRAIGHGDMSYRLRVDEMGDLGEEAAALNGLAEAVGEAVERMSGLTANLQRLPEAVADSMAEIEQGARNQEAAVEETASLIANINTSIRGINGEVDQLALNNEETASSVIETTTAVEQVARAATDLQRSLEASTSAAQEIGVQIRRVDEGSDTVQQAAEETAAAIAEMDRAIQEVGEHVSGASQLTEKVSESAEEGSRAVGETIDGIAKIRNLTLDARVALEGLDARIEEIGEITTVIDGISDETSLLSLNAAIIAAQAGEHGRAFAVVANQVKILARRTIESTQRIGQLIEGVQRESKNAVRAMGAGIEAVEDGVARSRRAGEALGTITLSSRDASGRVAEIARAADEQSRNSRHVAATAQQTSEHVQQISAAINEQRQATEQLLQNSTEALELCRQVGHATEEQRETGRYISTNITGITEMIRIIQEKTAAHERASTGMTEAVISILDNARKSCERVPEVARVVADLQQQAEAVGHEVTRFQTATRRADRATD